MNTLHNIWVRYGTSNNLKAVYILVTLIALAMAGGAPSIGSGN